MRSQLLFALLLTAQAVLVSSCSGGSWFARRSTGQVGMFNNSSRQEPALSGQGRFLASIVDRGGQATLMLQEQPSGQIVPLRHFQSHQPHSSPSLSWNGRYVAALVQQGNQRLALIEDRANGKMHRLPLPADRTAVRLSLSPEASQLAVQVAQGGQWRVQLFDLRSLLEPDLPGGIAIQGGGANPSP